jgi:hypothetical protein
MRISWILPAIALAALVAGCGGDDEDGAPTTIVRQDTPVAVRSATAPAAEPTVAGEIEVTGIVGSVNLSSRTIQIDRIRGADVTQIDIAPATTMRYADGRPIGLGQVRPSDRIIAHGQLSERGSLVARLVEVQEVVPGSAPGG